MACTVPRSSCASSFHHARNGCATSFNGRQVALRFNRMRLAAPAPFTVARASGSGSDSNSAFFPLRLPEVIPGLRSNGAAVLLLQVLDMLAFLAAIDAAYSGDWSRIGVLTKGQELLLQQVVPGIVVAHAVCGVLSAFSAAAMNKSPIVAAVKGFLFGAAGLYEYSISPTSSKEQ